MRNYRQPWLSNPTTESIFILSPALLPVVVIMIFQDYFTSHEVSTIWWIVLVLCIDVSHVYSTLFRLYWDKQTFTAYKRLLIIIPAAGFIVGFSLHYYDSFLFWRILAYVAVYHFVRQQYGFMRLYSRKENNSRLYRWIDSMAIYSATLYPLLYWHVHATDKLAWFVKGDFVHLGLAEYFSWFTIGYASLAAVYVAKEIVLAVRMKLFNIPKNLIIVGTYASWYVGIVYYQGDLIFTLLNVVAHGIPYMALIWLYGEKKSTSDFAFNLKGVLIFMSVLVFLAYVEEYFWDSFVWRDHQHLFPALSSFTIETPLLMSLLVAFLVLPQVTHYVLDGFIWRFGKDQRARL